MFKEVQRKSGPRRRRAGRRKRPGAVWPVRAVRRGRRPGRAPPSATSSAAAAASSGPRRRPLRRVKKKNPSRSERWPAGTLWLGRRPNRGVLGFSGLASRLWSRPGADPGPPPAGLRARRGAVESSGPTVGPRKLPSPSGTRHPAAPPEGSASSPGVT